MNNVQLRLLLRGLRRGRNERRRQRFPVGRHASSYRWSSPEQRIIIPWKVYRAPVSTRYFSLPTVPHHAVSAWQASGTPWGASSPQRTATVNRSISYRNLITLPYLKVVAGSVSSLSLCEEELSGKFGESMMVVSLGFPLHHSSLGDRTSFSHSVLQTKLLNYIQLVTLFFFF